MNTMTASDFDDYGRLLQYLGQRAPVRLFVLVKALGLPADGASLYTFASFQQAQTVWVVVCVTDRRVAFVRLTGDRATWDFGEPEPQKIDTEIWVRARTDVDEVTLSEVDFHPGTGREAVWRAGYRVTIGERVLTLPPDIDGAKFRDEDYNTAQKLAQELAGHLLD